MQLQLVAVGKVQTAQRANAARLHHRAAHRASAANAGTAAGQRRVGGPLLSELELFVEALLLADEMQSGALERVQARIDSAHERDHTFELLLQENNRIHIERRHGRCCGGRGGGGGRRRERSRR